MPDDFPPRLKELCDQHGILYVDDEVQSGIGRTGPVWAIEHYGVEPDLVVVRQVARRRAAAGGCHRARRRSWTLCRRAVSAAPSAATRVSCAAASAVLDEVSTRRVPPPCRASSASGSAPALDGDRRAASTPSARCAGSGPMLALELVERPRDEGAGSGAGQATTTAARERGLILLACGLYGNVIRILVPLVVSATRISTEASRSSRKPLSTQPQRADRRSRRGAASADDRPGVSRSAAFAGIGNPSQALVANEEAHGQGLRLVRARARRRALRAPRRALRGTVRGRRSGTGRSSASVRRAGVRLLRRVGVPRHGRVQGGGAHGRSSTPRARTRQEMGIPFHVHFAECQRDDRAGPPGARRSRASSASSGSSTRRRRPARRSRSTGPRS